MPAKQKTAAALDRQCYDWNKANPIGTDVEYHPTIGAPGYRLGKTTSEAWILSGHTVVVKLDCQSGCVALDACVPLTPEETVQRRLKRAGKSFVIMSNDFPESVAKTRAAADTEVERLKKLYDEPLSGAFVRRHIRWHEVQNA